MREVPKVSLTEGARVGNGCEDARVLDVCVDDVSMDGSMCEGARGPNGSRPQYLFENVMKEKKKKEKKSLRKATERADAGRTRGRNKAATVRGRKWLVTERGGSSVWRRKISREHLRR